MLIMSCWILHSKASIHPLQSAGYARAVDSKGSTRSFVNTVKKAHEEGYYVTLFFLWLDSVEQAIDRVKSRVADGGHNIPEETIRRRYSRGIENLFSLYIPICNYWILVNNSGTSLQRIARGEFSEILEIINENDWRKING